LHDIGLLFLLHNYPDKYKIILTETKKSGSLEEKELEVFGITHSEISKHLLKEWRIPNEIIDAVTSHHSTSVIDQLSQLNLIVRLAIMITKDRFSGYHDNLEERLEGINQVAAALKISKEQVDEITGSVLNETIAISTYLGVDIGDTEEMLVKANQEIWKTYFIIENLFKERQELTQNLLEEDRAKGMVESQNIAMATLSHYLNNATMSISGRSELLRMMLSNNEHEKLIERLPDALNKIETSVRKIVAVIEEMKHVSPMDQEKFNDLSKAMNIDDLISARMKKLEEAERKMLQMALEE
jgi:signal transduction histidine kinase